MDPVFQAKENSRYSIHIEYLPPSKNITNVNTIDIMNPDCIYKPDAHKQIWIFSKSFRACWGWDLPRQPGSIQQVYLEKQPKTACLSLFITSSLHSFLQHLYTCWIIYCWINSGKTSSTKTKFGDFGKLNALIFGINSQQLLCFWPAISSKYDFKASSLKYLTGPLLSYLITI